MFIVADSTVGVPDANKTFTGFRGDPKERARNNLPISNLLFYPSLSDLIRYVE